MPVRHGMRAVRSRGAFMGAVAAAGAAARVGAAEAFTLRMNVSTGATSALGLSAVHFAEGVGRRSRGQIKVDVYPNLQLGTEKESIDGLTTGTIDMAIQNTTWIVPLIPRFQVFDMPFLFRTSTHAWRTLDGPIGAEFAADLEGKGIVPLTWASGGFKELETASKVIQVPEDMKGLRFRIQSGATFVAMYQALGAIPVTIDLSEAFTGLAQHTVDGLDATLDNLSSSNLKTVVKHVAMSNHIFSVIPLMISKRKFDSMPPALQTVLREEGKLLAPFWRDNVAAHFTDAIKILKDSGLTFTDLQYAVFRKAMDPVYKAFEPKLGASLLDRIAKLANA